MYVQLVATIGARRGGWVAGTGRHAAKNGRGSAREELRGGGSLLGGRRGSGWVTQVRVRVRVVEA